MEKHPRDTDAHQTFEDRPGGHGNYDGLNRIVHSLVVGFVVWLALWIFAILTVVQWGFLAFTGGTNAHVKEFLSKVAFYISQALRYLAFVSEHRPFPFAPWPQATTTGWEDDGSQT